MTSTKDGMAMCAAAARISTMDGSAHAIGAARYEDKKNLSLIKKVLNSGHESILEHDEMTIAFTDVSVLVEQFMIEHRLASFMVKSRRYVDFSGAGYYVPEGLPSEAEALYRRAMEDRFSDYRRLIDLKIPKEDARFVLPYCFFSNFFMTVNARTLIHLIVDMLKGRGRGIAEIEALGLQLKAQFDETYPGVIDRALDHARAYRGARVLGEVANPRVVKGDARLIGRPADSKELLAQTLAFCNRFTTDELGELTRDARPRELESLSYTLRFDNVSLACLTHFARHRIHSPIFPPIEGAILGGKHILPDSIRAVDAAAEIYLHAFEQMAHWARQAINDESLKNIIAYFSLSGHVVDFQTTVNAREWLTISRLRTCRRAQWEIRDLALIALQKLYPEDPSLFSHYGPGCLVDGRCPEGRLSCGAPFSSREELMGS